MGISRLAKMASDLEIGSLEILGVNPLHCFLRLVLCYI
jgi:hypothetical protein